MHPTRTGRNAQESKSARVHGSKSTRVQGSKAPHVQTFKSTRVQECKSPRVKLYKFPMIQKSNSNGQLSKRPRVQEYKGARVQGSNNPTIEGSKGMVRGFKRPKQKKTSIPSARPLLVVSRVCYFCEDLSVSSTECVSLSSLASSMLG